MVFKQVQAARRAAHRHHAQSQRTAQTSDFVFFDSKKILSAEHTSTPFNDHGLFSVNVRLCVRACCCFPEQWAVGFHAAVIKHGFHNNSLLKQYNSRLLFYR